MDRMREFTRKAIVLAVSACCSTGFGAGFCSASIAESDSDNVVVLNELPLSLQTLDRQRGGFIDANGLTIKIGLEKVVLVDGVVAARSQLVMPTMNLQSAMSRSMDAAKETMAESKNMMEETMGNAQNNGAFQFGGASLDVNANAQTGVNTDAATLSLANMNQTSVNQPAVAASAPMTESQHAMQETSQQSMQQSTQHIPLSSQPSTLVNQALTQVTQVGNTTLIQNAGNNKLIQTVQVMNIELSNLSAFRGQRTQSRLLPQMIQYSR